jgi:hypothetical protein
MKITLFNSGRKRLVAGSAALLVAASLGIAAATTGSSAPSNAARYGRGVPEFGMTAAHFNGTVRSFTYTKGFYCDTAVPAASSTGCEVGAKWKNPPSHQFDPLYVVVPLGPAATGAMSMECPTGLVCVDHPGTLDMTRIESALKPLYPTLTNAQLTAALRNFATPGHEHFITDLNGGFPEWWDVRVVGVTNKAEYDAILSHGTASFLLHESWAHRTTPVIPTNLFLFFSVK